MKSLSTLLTLLMIGFLSSCMTEEAEVTELEFSKRASGANSAEAFRNTVHPLLVQRCGTCHGDGGNNIKHAVSNYKEAHDVVVDGGKVDFSNTANSRLVDKLASQQHNCWDGDCAASAAQMLAAIEEWKELRGSAPINLDGATTGGLKYGNANRVNPETINGSIMMQAEDAALSGRMKPHVHSEASNYSYIAGDMPPMHPIEQTERDSDISGGCRYMTAADLAETTNGRYRLSERRRHVNQQGYRYYSSRIRFRVIRPELRSAYQAEILAGRTSLANLERFFLASGAPDDDDPTILTGNDELDAGTALRTLPEFMEYSDYLVNINSQDASFADFFAPRFGEGGIDYFAPTNEEIRAGLPTYLKQYVIYDKVINKFREYFYDNNNGNWVPENSVNGAPYILRSMPDGGGGITLFQANNQTLSDQFYAYYLGSLTQGNALGPVSGSDPTHLIDTYVHYFVDPNDRAFEDFNWDYNGNRDSFDLNRGNTNLNLSALLADNSLVDDRSIMTENYTETLYPIVRANCAGCHGDNSGRPQFANANTSIAFDAMIGFTNFGTPANSRPATRMDEGHNCGANCASLKAEMEAAIATWNTQNIADIEAAQNNTELELKSLTNKERTPGRATFTFDVTEAGAYSVWLKVLTTNDKRRFNLRILDAQNRPIPNCQADQQCLVTSSTYANRTAAQIDEMNCRNFNTGTHNEWSWYTPSIDDEENRIKWDLGVGTYKLEILEDDINAKIDLVAISKNPEFNPAKNLIDEGFIASAEPRILRYDIRQFLGGSPGFFEIEISEKNGGDSYVFRNPRFVGNTRNIKVKNIKVLVNDKYEFTDTSFSKIDVVVGTEKTNLTYAPLVALSIAGLGVDTFKFVFEELRATDAPESIPEDDAPVPVEGRKCQNLTLFENTVMPVLNRFRLIRKDEDGYTDYTSDDGMFPGTNRNGGTNPQFYTCTTCHTEEHPYFKMTTFFDNTEVLCEQALSRVDFGNFERSLLLRGLNGTFNHPKLHFVESVDYTGNGNSRRFRTNPAKVNGFDSSWAGLRFDKYSEGTGSMQINLGAYSGAQRAYLEKFIGQYVRTTPVRINDPFATRDGQIRLPGDSYNAASPEQDKWTYAGSGRNMFNVINPESFVNNQNALDPDSVTSGGLVKVRNACLNVNFNENNGVTTDPCNSNVDVISEFEVIKTRYRESIINWMNEEKRSYEALND